MTLTHARVPVYFRIEDLPEAYAFAATLEKGSDAVVESLAPIAEAVLEGWSREQIERAYRESPEGMMRIFDGMMDRPAEVLDSSDLASFLTHKPNADEVTVRGTMGAFANRCASRYGREHDDYPFRHWYVEGGYARYQMSAEVADVLRPLRDVSRLVSP